MFLLANFLISQLALGVGKVQELSSILATFFFIKSWNVFGEIVVWMCSCTRSQSCCGLAMNRTKRKLCIWLIWKTKEKISFQLTKKFKIIKVIKWHSEMDCSATPLVRLIRHFCPLSKYRGVRTWCNNGKKPRPQF